MTKHYFLTIFDDNSMYTWIYLLKPKRDMTIVLKKFLLFLRIQFTHFVKTIITDNEIEFFNKKIDELVTRYGVVHQISCVIPLSKMK